MYKVVKAAEGIVRTIADNKSVNNLITKDISPGMSLATTKATDYYEKETAAYDRIYYVLEGRLDLSFDHQTTAIDKSDACFIARGTEYEMRGTFEAVVINQPAFGS
jgi:ethanolamine utilization protein EutQ (cupin superfamily)